MQQRIQWHNSTSISQLEFRPGLVRDTTSAARNKLAARRLPVQLQYLSRPVDIPQLGDGEPVELPALYLGGVRVLHQSAAPKGYARTKVLLAVPLETVLPIVDSLAGQGVRFFSRAEYVQGQRFVHQAGTDWTVFTSWQLDKDVPVRVVRGQGDWDDLDLADELAEHRTDLVADVAFKVELKYRGGIVADLSEAPMSLKLTATAIHPYALATAPLDP